MTEYAGLELFGRFLRAEGWLDRIRGVFADRQFDSDYGSLRMSPMTLALMRLGGSRLAHLDQLRLDPLFHRFTCHRRLPSARTFSTQPWIPKWKKAIRVVVYRRKISGKPAKAYQLNLLQPDTGYYEYSMVVTRRRWVS